MSKSTFILSLCITGFVFGLSLYLLIPNPSNILGSTGYSAAEILSLTNAARQTNGLPPLTLNDQLTQAAEAKAQAMLDAKSWSHNTPDQTPWQFLDQVGYVYAFAGENLAKNFIEAPQVIDAWLDSPSHRANLLSPTYTETGVAILPYPDSDNNSVLIVQYLAKPIDQQNSNSNLESFNPTSIVEQPNYDLKTIYILVGLILSAAAGLIIFKLISRHPKPTPPSAHHWRK